MCFRSKMSQEGRTLSRTHSRIWPPKLEEESTITNGPSQGVRTIPSVWLRPKSQTPPGKGWGSRRVWKWGAGEREAHSSESRELERTGKEKWRWTRSERKKEVRGETDRNRRTEGGVPRAGRRAQASKPTSRRAPPGPRPAPHRPVDPFGSHKTSAPGVLARALGLDSFLD